MPRKTPVQQFPCPVPLRRRLEAESKRTGLSMSDVIRRALEFYFAAKEKK